MDRTRTKKSGPDSLYEKPLPIKGKTEVQFLALTAVYDLGWPERQGGCVAHFIYTNQGGDTAIHLFIQSRFKILDRLF